MTTPDPTPTPVQMLELFAQNIEAHQEAEAARKVLGALPWPRQSDDDPELEAAQQRRVDALKRSVAVSQQALDLDPALIRAQAAALAEREAECERLRRAVANVEELARDWRNQAWANDAAGAPKSAADKAISPTLKVCAYRLNKAIIPAQEAPQ